MRQIIYADNAATTKLDSDAFEAMKPYLLDEYGNPSKPYFFSMKPKMAVIKRVRQLLNVLGLNQAKSFSLQVEQRATIGPLNVMAVRLEMLE